MAVGWVVEEFVLDSLVHILEAVVGVDVAHGVIDTDWCWVEAVLLHGEDHGACAWCDVNGDHVWCVNSDIHRSILFSRIFIVLFSFLHYLL